MKIIINSKESYEVELQDEISLEQFQYLIARFQELNKVFNKFNNVSSNQDVEKIKEDKKVRKRGQFLPRYDRTHAIKYITLFYKDNKAFLDYIRELGYEHLQENSFSSILSKIKNDFNIKPEEVGMIKFPSRGDWRNIKNLFINKEDANGTTN